MTPEEVADIARRDFDIQLHTHRHRTPREESIFRAELVENRRVLEKLPDALPVHFCYPVGSRPRFFTLAARPPSGNGDDMRAGLARAEYGPLLLPRYVDTMAQSEVMFESWLSGAAGC